MVPPLKPLNLSLTTADQADLGSAIQSAIRMISSAPARSARQLIYIIAASDSSETARYANQCEKRHDATCDVDKFKAAGGIIAVTEAYSSLDVGWLADLASPGYYDTSFVDDSSYYLKLLCFANCFCPLGLIPFSRPDALNRNAPDGGCFFSQSNAAVYSTAKKMCQSSGARLATIRDLYKQFMRASGGKPTWIGGVFNGEQLEPIDDSTAQYTNWAAGERNASRGRCAYSRQLGQYTSANGQCCSSKYGISEDCSVAKKYMCELAPCSVDNYCK